MSSLFKVTRSIGIDAGHRVPTHGSKCANFHGHRYTIEATASANSLQAEGEQAQMIIDFSWLKDIMMNRIDHLCDHGLILWKDDPWLFSFLEDKSENGSYSLVNDLLRKMRPLAPFTTDYVFQEGSRGHPTKLLVVPFIPTAEALAQFWYYLMRKDVQDRSQGFADLYQVIVHETPNCSGIYGPTAD